MPSRTANGFRAGTSLGTTDHGRKGMGGGKDKRGLERKGWWRHRIIVSVMYALAPRLGRDWSGLDSLYLGLAGAQQKALILHPATLSSSMLSSNYRQSYRPPSARFRRAAHFACSTSSRRSCLRTPSRVFNFLRALQHFLALCQCVESRRSHSVCLLPRTGLPVFA